MTVSEQPVSQRRRGGQDSLLAAKTLAEMQNAVRHELQVAILQARRDGWSLRALAQHLNMGYSTVKRHSEAAESRGQ